MDAYDEAKIWAAMVEERMAAQGGSVSFSAGLEAGAKAEFDFGNQDHTAADGATDYTGGSSSDIAGQVNGSTTPPGFGGTCSLGEGCAGGLFPNKISTSTLKRGAACKRTFLLKEKRESIV